MTCCVPAPPGVSGTSVESPATTITSPAVGSDAGSPKAASRKKTTAIRHVHAPACTSTTWRA